MLKREKRALALTVLVGVVVVVGAIAAIIHRWIRWYEYSDFANLVLLGEVEVGHDHLEGVFTPEGKRLYVLDVLPGRTNVVHVIDVEGCSIVARVPLGPGFPMSITATPDGRSILVGLTSYRGGPNGGNAGESRMVSIDTATNDVSREIELNGAPVGGVTVSHDGKTAYIADRIGGAVHEIDLAAFANKGVIKLPGGTYGLSMKPASGLLYAVSTRTGQECILSAVDTGTRNVVASVPVGLRRCTHRSQVHIPGDGRRLYVLHTQDHRIAVVDIDSSSETYHTVLDTLEVPGDLVGAMAFNNKGTLALVNIDGNRYLLLDTDPTSFTFHRFLGTGPVADSNDIAVYAPSDRPPIVSFMDNKTQRLRIYGRGKARKIDGTE